VLYTVVKFAISAALIVAISEIAKRSSLLGAILASVPLVSVLAMIWLYVDTRDVEKIASLATGIFWLVIPSLVLFVSLPLLLRAGMHFYLSLPLSIAFTVVAYFAMIAMLKKVGIEI
jgi:hypothetical protein